MKKIVRIGWQGLRDFSDIQKTLWLIAQLYDHFAIMPLDAVRIRERWHVFNEGIIFRFFIKPQNIDRPLQNILKISLIIGV